MNNVTPPCKTPPVLYSYLLTTDYWYYPPNGDAAKHMVFHYTYENPDISIARQSVLRQVEKIKSTLEKGDSTRKYNYEGLHLCLQFGVESPLDEVGVKLMKRFIILDGKPVSKNEFLERFEVDSYLLKSTHASDDCDDWLWHHN